MNEEHRDTIRVRSTFSKTIKGGWTDDSTIELHLDLNGHSNWQGLMEHAIKELRRITEAECRYRNERDNFTGGF